jgi:hypothetical protein
MLATSHAGGPQRHVCVQPPVNRVLHIRNGRSVAEAQHREIAWHECTDDLGQLAGRDLRRGRWGCVELAHHREQAGLTGDRPVVHVATIRRIGDVA